MRVHLGCDHAGYELKERLRGWLTERGVAITDHGPAQFDAEDDYPAFCFAAAEAAAADPTSRGVVIGGSGNGEAIAANKVPGVRAALCWSVETAVLAREHNDANVLSLSARLYPAELAVAIVDTFLATPFSGEERHVRRIGQLTAYEQPGRADR